MPMDLYYAPFSPHCRAVLFTANVLNLKLNLKKIDLESKEHMSPEYLQINPQHKVPVLVEEDGFVLAESRAIMTYLVDKYAPDTPLYPKDLKTRALINQRLYFDVSSFYPRCINYLTPIWKKLTPPDPYKFAKLQEALKFLDKFLDGQDYVTGPNFTLADISLVAGVTTLIECKIDLKYDSIKIWYERVKSVAPGFQEAITNNLKPNILEQVKTF